MSRRVSDNAIQDRVVTAYAVRGDTCGLYCQCPLTHTRNCMMNFSISSQIAPIQALDLTSCELDSLLLLCRGGRRLRAMAGS